MKGTGKRSMAVLLSLLMMLETTANVWAMAPDAGQATEESPAAVTDDSGETEILRAEVSAEYQMEGPDENRNDAHSENDGQMDNQAGDEEKNQAGDPMEAEEENPVCEDSDAAAQEESETSEKTEEKDMQDNPTETPTPTATPTPVETPAEKDGVKVLKSDGTEFSMFKIAQYAASVKGDQIELTISTDNTSFDRLYLGSNGDADKTPVISGTEKENGGWTFTFTVPLDKKGSSIPVCLGKKDGTWYTKQDLVLTIPNVESSSDPEPTPEPTPTPPEVPEDGIYQTTAETGAAMFKVVDVKLTVKNRKMSAVITLSGTGYDYLYMGTGAEAEKADSAQWIPVKEKVTYIDENGNEKNGCSYEIPVEELDTALAVASHSSSKNAWYDRSVMIHSADLEKIGNLPSEGGDNPSGPDSKPEEGNKPAGSGGAEEKPPVNDGKEDSESKYESDLSGSTSVVNSLTNLPDGVYTPDGFSWSGGTGKVSISCSKVTIRNGQALATLVFGSASYSYVKANGRTYYGTVSGGRSVFVIPVELNKNNTIIGMTTKMTAAHEIAYSIFVYLSAAGSGSAAAGGNSGKELDNEAPQIMGLEYESETDVDHAEYFRIFHYQDGITLLEIDMTKDTARDPEKMKEKDEEETSSGAKDDDTSEKEDSETDFAEDGTEAETSVQTSEEVAAELYRQNVVKYLIVPEKVEIPAGLDKEMIVIQLPADRVYAASEEAVAAMEELDLLDCIAAVDVEEKDCGQKDLKKAMEEEKVFFAGAFDDPDYKQLVKSKVDLAILSGEILPEEEESEANTSTEEKKSSEKTDGKESGVSTDEEEQKKTAEEQTRLLEDITERFATLGIPMIVDRSTMEKTEQAKCEWIKVYGVLFGCEEMAQKLYDEAIGMIK